ncbi:ADP-ribosylglycohydrolase family protein [Pseudobacteroides cellulosolvens]|uniref:ADP-ribosylation/Crystallin J1 n=1 Tax=Pseudobacteroides cellulosolvens ATCC 35603 = DSM 2933 TaxID=398512 RepID=A0A0L6JN41_9FIRM|nr:ADP-ribosylglycohydrolase family protein [Pseudobacteroides cellulosolvens]KNY27216.1 ADP-ribosylation/Crystallin J1 [Pseudobacteroides cellulosolvens ATCC 35603 = DSM 2933]
MNLSRIEFAKTSLIGLSVGDAFGETFFGEEKQILDRITKRELKPPLWHFTDDTVMGIAIYKTLEQYGEIRQDKLAKLFADNYSKDWHRGYGGTAHSILRSIGSGESWLISSRKAFDGMGSMGNGAAMRAAPIGAYFYDDIKKIKEQARFSAEVTHFNEEGIAGAIAVALAAGIILEHKLLLKEMNAAEFIEKIFYEMPESDTKYSIRKALQVSKDSSIDFAVSVLGNGSRITAQDTIPFAIWCIAHFRNNYEEALWKTVSALGDRDTTCAIVGSVVVLNTEVKGIPSLWLNTTEPIEESLFY